MKLNKNIWKIGQFRSLVTATAKQSYAIKSTIGVNTATVGPVLAISISAKRMPYESMKP